MATTKNKSKSIFNLFNLITLVPNVMSIFTNLMTLFRLEAQNTGKSLAKIIVLTLMFACVLTSTWIMLLGILFLYLAHLQIPYITAMFIILLLNIIALFIIGILLARAKNNAFFPETRKQIRQLVK